MSHLTRNKIIVYLAAIFVVGGITGAVFGWTNAKEKWSHVSSPKNICDRFRKGLQSELNLTPDQMQRIDPILDRRARQMQAIHDRTVKEIEALVRASNEEIAQVLDPAQREKFEQLEKERRGRWGNKPKGGSPPPE